jgi:hypothetical protein
MIGLKRIVNGKDQVKQAFRRSAPLCFSRHAVEERERRVRYHVGLYEILDAENDWFIASSSGHNGARDNNMKESP